MEKLDTKSNTSLSTTASVKPTYEEFKVDMVELPDLNAKIKEFENQFNQMNVAMVEKLKDAFVGT